MKFAIAGALSLALYGALAAGIEGRWENGPQGVYYMQVYQVVSRNLERRVYLFRGNEWVQDPEGDIATVNIASAHPAWRGTWRYTGGTFTLAPAQGAPDIEAITPDSEGCFQFINGIWCPAKPFTTMIDGAYSGGTSSGGLSTASDYRFSPDGTYTALHVGSYQNSEDDAAPSGDTSDPSVRATASGDTRGHYRIEGMMLVLTPDSGPETRAIAFPASGDTNTTRPAYIYFGGIVMQRTGD